MSSVTHAELSDKLDSQPQSLVGMTYNGCLATMPDDAAYALHVGDYVLIVDFDRTILEVIEKE